MDVTSYLLGKKAGGGGSAPVLQDKEVEITENGETTITADSGYDGLSSVEVTTNVPSGISINGTLENKTIDNGSVSKGDFVTYGISTKNDFLSSENDYFIQTGSVSISNKNNILDGNLSTYGTINGGSSTSPRIYIRCKSNSQLNIPSNVKITGFYCNIKVSFTAQGIIGLTLYHNFAPSPTVPSITSFGSITKNADEIIEETINFFSYFSAFDVVSNGINNLGIQLFTTTNASKINIYNISFTIEYEDGDKIKKVTSEADTIIGIANEDGTTGDTIEVYVPNTSNQ